MLLAIHLHDPSIIATKITATQFAKQGSLYEERSGNNSRHACTISRQMLRAYGMNPEGEACGHRKQSWEIKVCGAPLRRAGRGSVRGITACQGGATAAASQPGLYVKGLVTGVLGDAPGGAASGW